MKNMTRKFLAAGLIAGALTFVGCKSDKAAEQPADTTQGTDTGTTTTPAEGTGTGTGTETGTPPGTGGAGADDVSKTKQSDDNLRYPEEDPLRTPESESIRDAEREDERGVHDSEAGTGGSGFGDRDVDESLNEGGDVDDTHLPDSPMDTTPDNPMIDETQIPEGTR